MLNNIIKLTDNVSLRNGCIFRDKSYAFDTIYFISKLILRNQANNIFYKKELCNLSVPYIEDIFQLQKGASGVKNYFLESIDFLEYSKVISRIDSKKYKIKDIDILNYLTTSLENTYIFMYLVAYKTFQNDGLDEIYIKYCNTNDDNEKIEFVNLLYEKYVDVCQSKIQAGSNWSKQLVKYPLTVLGFVNSQNHIARTLNTNNKKLSIQDISLNVAGTKTPEDRPKKADYLDSFNYDYVIMNLEDYLIVPEEYDKTKVDISDNVATSLADLKLSILESENKKDLDDEEKAQYIEGEVRQRNQSVQRQFRNDLLENNSHCCPICGYSFEPFLIASHIKPYSKCDDTYDAINHFNGFLMCPNHDKLFEDAKHMTIDYKTGEIKLSEEAKNSKDYSDLLGKRISKSYIDNERRHYLEWHNNRFKEHIDYAIQELES